MSLRPRQTSGLQLALLLLVFSVKAAAETPWTKVTSPNFELLGTASESGAREALAALENARTFFEGSSDLPFRPDDDRIRIIAFQSQEEYAPYRLHQTAFAHYLKSRRGRDYIVLQDLRPEHREAVLHEFTHYVVRHAGLTLPLWLNEGLADFYSSIRVNGGRAIIGMPLTSRLKTLRRERWLPLTDVLASTQQSSYSAESQIVSTFYAQSWALTHMLALDRAYSADFARFLRAAAAGIDSAAALETVYGKKPGQVEADVRAYVSRLASESSSMELPMQEEHSEPVVTSLSEAETELAVADLLVAQPWTSVQAKAKLATLAATLSGNANIEELSGYLSWQEGNIQDAGVHLRKAVELGSRDPESLYHLAQVERQAGASTARVVGLLEQVVAAKPNYQDAVFNLAILQFNDRRFAEAARTVSGVSSVRPEWEYTYYCLLAYCNLHSRDAERARIFGNMAKQHATTAGEKDQADRLLQRLAAFGS